MKKFYLFIAAAFVSLMATAQIYSTGFDSPVEETFLSKGPFLVNQNGSNLVLFSQGHDEWDNVGFTFNDGLGTTSIAISKTDTFYVRAKVITNDTVNPKLSFGLLDANGVGPNNQLYNDQNSMTLTSSWQVFKFTVPNVTMEFGDPNDPNLGSDLDTMNVTKMTLGLNTGFASFPSINANNQTIAAPFNGTVYIDYLSVGGKGTDGQDQTLVTTFTQTFDTDISSDISGGPSFTVTSGAGSLSIISAGHTEWETIRYTLPNTVVDITNNAALQFTASVSPDAGYTGEVGIMVVLVDEKGTRIEYPGLFSLQSFSSSQTYKLAFPELKYVTDITTAVNGTRIAYLDILVNPGFNSFPLINDEGKSVTTAFEGTITIDEIKIGDGILVDGIEDVSLTPLSIYPNPVVSLLNIDANLIGGTYKIIDLQGVIVLEGNVDEAIATDELDGGMYFIQVNKEDKLFGTTFVK